LGNSERQLYTNENHKFVKGNLVITAKKEEGKYTSLLESRPKGKEFQYGYFEKSYRYPVMYAYSQLSGC
jgi:hypothetical protein